MQYFVEEIADTVVALQALLDRVSGNGGRLINVIWRETDNVYVVIHAV
jgi:hypothetical protein